MNNSYHKIVNTAGWLVFAIAFIVYFFTVERTGSLWDCGEFITGAYKLEVVHPPGAALFLLIGRVFTMIPDMFSSDGADISHAVNLLSGMSSAFMAMLVCWVTIILGRMMIKEGREVIPTQTETMGLAVGGVVAGLTAAFCTSIWFSAVEGEVYAMSTFFTALTLWAMMKWYILPDEPKSDRWLVFAVYAAALSTGVHLLSLLTFPALALFYYFKKYENHNIVGLGAAVLGGVAALIFVQKIVIVGIPTLWAKLEVLMVNGLGMPFQSGIFPLILILGAIFFFGFRYINQNRRQTLQLVFMGACLTVIAFSTIGVVVIRANADTPINMNDPSDPLRLIPYLNREQYGERPLLKGPTFDAEITGTNSEDRMGRKGDDYQIVDRKLSYKFDQRKEIIFPRIGHYEMGRPRQHKIWMGLDPDKPLPAGRPNQADNLSYFFNYQIKWMYFRYFMWNFTGRQNGVQGYFPNDKTRGHWASGISFIDNNRLFDFSNAPDRVKNDKAYNKYFFLPFLLGLLGLLFHLRNRPKEFLGLFTLFIITGIGIIIYSNQPPNEPRERDYVLAGSFFTYSIWVGMGVIALFSMLKDRMGGLTPVLVAGLIGIMAPTIMCVQNWDDHTRRHHTGASDYARNFLESCEPNAIIFTYGDNDTYPLWYAQGMISAQDTAVIDRMSFSLGNKSGLIKGDMAVLDIISSNINDRPIYFAVTCREESLLGLDDYLQLEGLALRLVPKKNDGDARLGIIGKGIVKSDKVYDNVMTKFQWGNFDKYDLFVDRSYLPSVQSHRLVILRACEDLLKKGDRTKAGNLAKKYFESFPPMNFPLDEQSIPMLKILISAGQNEVAKPLIMNLATETKQYLDFMAPMTVSEMRENGWLDKYAYLISRTKDETIRMAGGVGDDGLKQTVSDMLAGYEAKR